MLKSLCLNGVATIFGPENMVTLSRQLSRMPSSDKLLLEFTRFKFVNNFVNIGTLQKNPLFMYI